MKVLMVKLSAFGDLIHCLPALDDVLARDDVDEVHWLVDERFAFVTEVFPADVRIHTVALKGEHPLQAAWQAIKALRSECFDLVIDLQTLMKSSLIAAATGARVFGCDAREVKEKPATWLQKSTFFHANERHVVQKYRHVAAAPWQTDEEAKQAMAYVPPKIHQALHDVPLPDGLPDKPWVTLSLGGSWQTKELPDRTWQTLVAGIHAQGWHPLICWGNHAEYEKAQRIVADGRATVLPERLAMLPLCALLKQSAALIATDTGVLHLAAALDVPTISFWGPSASWRSGPLGQQHQQVESNPLCGPCFQRRCANFTCMDMIRAEEIVACLDRIGQGDELG